MLSRPPVVTAGLISHNSPLVLSLLQSSPSSSYLVGFLGSSYALVLKQLAIPFPSGLNGKRW